MKCKYSEEGLSIMSKGWRIRSKDKRGRIVGSGKDWYYVIWDNVKKKYQIHKSFIEKITEPEEPIPLTQTIPSGSNTVQNTEEGV